MSVAGGVSILVWIIILIVVVIVVIVLLKLVVGVIMVGPYAVDTTNAENFLLLLRQ